MFTYFRHVLLWHPWSSLWAFGFRLHCICFHLRFSAVLFDIVLVHNLIRVQLRLSLCSCEKFLVPPFWLNCSVLSFTHSWYFLLYSSPSPHSVHRCTEYYCLSHLPLVFVRYSIVLPSVAPYFLVSLGFIRLRRLDMGCLLFECGSLCLLFLLLLLWYRCLWTFSTHAHST